MEDGTKHHPGHGMLCAEDAQLARHHPKVCVSHSKTNACYMYKCIDVCTVYILYGGVDTQIYIYI